MLAYIDKWCLFFSSLFNGLSRPSLSFVGKANLGGDLKALSWHPFLLLCAPLVQRLHCSFFIDFISLVPLFRVYFEGSKDQKKNEDEYEKTTKIGGGKGKAKSAEKRRTVANDESARGERRRGIRRAEAWSC